MKNSSEVSPGRKPILIVTLAGVAQKRSAVSIDRKFHVGMLEYARRLDRPLACLAPSLAPADLAMDNIDVPIAELPYALHLVSMSMHAREDRAVVEDAVRRAALVYVGCAGEFNLGVADVARMHGVPYVALSECSLRTEIEIMRSTTPSRLRRWVREHRLRRLHRRKMQMVQRSAELHANGYPSYAELGPLKPGALLYFDTRAFASDVCHEAEVEARLGSLSNRPARLLFSGRYHSIKGALDAVAAGIDLHRLGVDFRLDTYGTGPLKAAMVTLATRSNASERIAIHDAIPYTPDLVTVTREADLFVACHVQGDPSCTYLETFACGVPIVGYANEMWSALCSDSGGGLATPVGEPRGVALAAAQLLTDRSALRAASLAARRFALANTMETAWNVRAARLAALADIADPLRR